MSGDIIVVDVPSMLAQKVTISDEHGERPDPGWNCEAAASQYVFAEFLSDKELLARGVSVARRPDLTIKWSQLSERGQAFTRAHFHKWLVSIKSGTSETSKKQKLEKRWAKFNAL